MYVVMPTIVADSSETNAVKTFARALKIFTWYFLLSLKASLRSRSFCPSNCVFSGATL